MATQNRVVRRSTGRAHKRGGFRARYVIYAILALVGLVVAYFGITFLQVWWASTHDEAQPADAIIVLGAAQYDGRPSPVLKARLDHAAELYDEGYAKTIVVTGGGQPDDRFTEATASANYLHGLGIPDSAILREVHGNTSFEELKASANFLEDHGIHKVLLVSDPYHSKRISTIAGDLGLDAHTSPANTDNPLSRLLRETFAVGVGRIIGFSRLDRLDEEREDSLRDLFDGL